jgi:hypothetical protein
MDYDVSSLLAFKALMHGQRLMIGIVGKPPLNFLPQRTALNSTTSYQCKREDLIN